jgi:hypothetical protein
MAASTAAPIRTLWHRLRIGLLVGFVLLVVYVISYAVLYTRGMNEVRLYGHSYFFYCPVSDLRHGEDLPYQHRLCVSVYDPINQFHISYFDGCSACHGVTWGLSR